MKPSRTETTIRAYDRNAANYADKFGAYRPYREKIEAFQQRFLTGRAAVLDVGCGPGINARIMLSGNSRLAITGIDLSAEMIALARQKAPGAVFRVQDIRALEPDRKYDAVIAAFCIVHLSDDETAGLLRTISSCLESGGYLYLSFMEGKPAGLETTSFSADRMYFNYPDREAVCAALRQNAIEPVEISTEDYRERDGSITTDVFIFGRKGQS